jgi:hypothetical protein
MMHRLVAVFKADLSSILVGIDIFTAYKPFLAVPGRISDVLISLPSLI